MTSLYKWIATADEIKDGKTTDVYFLRTIECLEKDGFDKIKVWAEVTTGGIPREGKRLVFLGLQDVLNLFLEAKLSVNIYAIKEGTVLPFKDYYGVRIPFLVIEGTYLVFAKYETPMLGLLCFQSGVGTSALRLRIAAENRTLLSFGIRRMPPFLAPTIDRACYLAGFDGVSCVLSAEKLGVSATGTIPHSLIMIEGGIKPALISFDRNVDPAVSRIALADTFNDERVEVLDALEAIGEKLEGVRLDTPGSRKGNMREIIQEIKWELKLKGRDDIKIFFSGGLTESSILEFRDLVDGFGIGTYVANSPTIDFAFDIVNIEGENIVKRGKFIGRKQVGYCEKCNIYLCAPFDQEKILCPSCKHEMVKMLEKLMEKGKLISVLPTENEIRKYIQNQRNHIKEM